MDRWSTKFATAAGDDRARSAWRVAMVSVVLNTLGITTMIPVFHRLPLWRFFYLSGTVSVALGVLLWMRRRTPTVWLGSAATLLNQVFIVIAIWVAADHVARTTGQAHVGLSVFRLGAMTAALLGPPVLWVGLAGIGAFICTQLVWLASLPGPLPPAEPSVTLLYCLFAIGLLLYRRHASHAERAVVRAQMEAIALEQLAYKFLAVRDLANTPLQTLLFVATQLREPSVDLTRLSARVDRSVERLRELMQTFAAYESKLKWRPGEEAFDPLTILRSH